jgi:hypothetical protein
MSIALRLWEKLTGRPHQHHNAGMVRLATERLVATNADFMARIRPYEESDNPLAMLLQDVLNQRAMRGDGHEPTKFHP